MIKKIFLFLLCLFSITIAYAYGYFKAVNEVIVFDKTMSSNVGLNTLNFIRQGDYERAIDYQRDNIEVNLAAVADVIKVSNSFESFPSRYIKYRRLYSVDFMEKYETVKKRFEDINSRSASKSIINGVQR